jgi:hypothetical protein
MAINNKPLLAAFEDWERTAPIKLAFDLKAFRDHMLSVYGIRLDPQTLFGNEKVVDEKKFMFFLLKYG